MKPNEFNAKTFIAGLTNKKLSITVNSQSNDVQTTIDISTLCDYARLAGILSYGKPWAGDYFEMGFHGRAVKVLEGLKPSTFYTAKVFVFCPDEDDAYFWQEFFTGGPGW